VVSGYFRGYLRPTVLRVEGPVVVLKEKVNKEQNIELSPP